MKNKTIVLILIGIVSSLMFNAFQCGTAEMTSAKLYIQRSEWENAKAQLQKEIEKHPNNSEAWYLLGRVQYEQKNYAEMLKAFDSSLRINNQFKKEINNFKLSVWASTLNKGVDNYNRGIQTLSSNPDSSNQYFNTALDYLKVSREAQPESVASYRVTALCYYGMRDKDNAIIFLKKALEKQFDLQLARMLGGIYYDRAMAAKNAAANAEGSEKDKLNETIKTNLDEAIKVYEMANKKSPDDINILAALNDSYIAAGRTDEAMNSYKLAINADPNNKLAHYNYGVLLLRAGYHAQAAKQFDETINLDPNFTDALYNAAAAYMQWGAKMRGEAEEAIKGDKTKSLDKAFEEKFRKAKTYLDKLVELSPDDISGWETLGMANATLNLQKEAKAAYDKADSLRKVK